VNSIGMKLRLIPPAPLDGFTEARRDAGAPRRFMSDDYPPILFWAPTRSRRAIRAVMGVNPSRFTKERTRQPSCRDGDLGRNAG